MSLIDQHYKHYLDKVALKESEMPEDQKIEIKRAFMAGMASMFVAELSTIESVEQYKNELAEYWNQEINIYDAHNRF